MNRDTLIGVFTIALSAIYLFLIRYQVQPDSDGYDNVSGRTLPYLVGFFLLFFGSLLALISARRGGQRKNISELTAIASNPAAKRVLIYLFLTILYLLGISYLGYVVSSIVALIILILFNGEKRLLLVCVVAVITSISLFYFFNTLMRIPLPPTLLF